MSKMILNDTNFTITSTNQQNNANATFHLNTNPANGQIPIVNNGNIISNITFTESLNVAGSLAVNANVTMVNPSNLEINHSLGTISGANGAENIAVNNESVVTLENHTKNAKKREFEINNNSLLTVKGKTGFVEKVTIDADSIISVELAPNQFFSLSNNTGQNLVIPDLYKAISLCSFLAKQSFSDKDFHLQLDCSDALRFYKQHKELIDSIFTPNENILGSKTQILDIQKYLNGHFFEITKVVHSLKDSALEIMPPEVMGEIISHLEIDDYGMIV